MSGKKTSSNILLSNAAGYAAFLGKRGDEFEKIEGSGYGYFWFPQCFYLYWQEGKKFDGLELWGNMGPHHVTNRVWQFSEVRCTQDEAHYRSDIFILTLTGVHKNTMRELDKIRACIYRSQLPFKLFLIRFDALDPSEEDPRRTDPDSLFADVVWQPSFNAISSMRLKQISIGVLNGSLGLCPEVERFLSI